MIYLLCYPNSSIEVQRHILPMKRAELEQIAGPELELVERGDDLALCFSPRAPELNPINFPFADRNFRGVVVCGKYKGDKFQGFEDLEEADRLLLKQLT